MFKTKSHPTLVWVHTPNQVIQHWGLGLDGDLGHVLTFRQPNLDVDTDPKTLVLIEFRLSYD